MSKKYTQQLNTMLSKMKEDIVKQIDKKGVKSEHRAENVIQVSPFTDLDFCMDDNKGQYVAEVSKTELISQNGYSYDHTILTMGELAEIVDYINSL